MASLRLQVAAVLSLWGSLPIAGAGQQFTVPRDSHPDGPHGTWKLLTRPAVGGIMAELNVRDFGAKADGSDDTAAFRAALAEAGADGNAIVNVPAGTYSIRGHLVVPPLTTLRGVNAGPYSQEGTATHIAGTTLQAFHGAHCETRNSGCDRADPFILLHGPSAAITGMSIVYPDQVNATASSPISYPWCIRGMGDNVLIQNLFLVNPYLGIDLGTHSAGRHLVDNVYGNPLKLGIFVDQTYDVGRIRHVHFWNFWAGRIQTDGPLTELQKWVGRHGVTLRLARTDWEVVDDVFSWGYHVGAQLVQSHIVDPQTNQSIGAMNGQFTNIQFDAVDIGVDVVQTNPYGVFFSNLNLANAGWGAVRIGIVGRPQSAGSSVVVRGASFWGRWYQAVQWDGPAFLTISESTIVEWDHHTTLHPPPLMNFTAGSVGVRGCRFGNHNHHPAASTWTTNGIAIAAGPQVQRLIVAGNDLLGMRIDCQAANALLDGNLV